MQQPETRPDIFDRKRRQVRRSRSYSMGGEAFLQGRLADEVAERVDDIATPLSSILLIGALTPKLREHLATKGEVTVVESAPDVAEKVGAIAADEDMLISTIHLQNRQFDAIAWPGGMESVNDIPGALIQCRRLLKPGGALIGGFFGGGSLPGLKAALLKAESERPVARMHPQIDVRSMGDLLLRCGFALPVIDSHALNVRYSRLSRLTQDLRESALTNLLSGDSTQMTRQSLSKLIEAYQSSVDPDGKVAETFHIILFSAWVPEGIQPAPPLERGQNLKR